MSDTRHIPRGTTFVRFATEAGDADGKAVAEGTEGPIPEADLHALMLQARRTNDAPLHRLVVGYLTLRRVTTDVVALVAAREGGAGVAGTPVFRRARDLAAAKPR